jgi:hypothetical protein
VRGRRLLGSLAVLVVLLVVADRIAVSLASATVAARLRASAQLRSDPSVSIKGFPFLTQAFRGRYDRIDVSLTGLSRGTSVRISRFDATLIGARVGLGDALGGSVSAVPVERLTASAVVSYADAASAAGLKDVRLAPAGGDTVRVTARPTVLGQQVTAEALSSVRVEGDDVVVTARSVKVLGTSSPAWEGALGGKLDLRIQIGRLPFGLELTGARVTAGGLVLTATAGTTVLSVPH